MNGADSVPPIPDAFADALASIGASAREQLAAAWQLHVERVQEQLQQGWTGHIDRVVEERFAELALRAQEEVERRVAERMALELELVREEDRGRARRQLTEQLNQSVRRVAASASAPEWGGALLDATRDFCARAALFSVSGDQLRCENVRVPDGHPAAALPGQSLPLAAAPAFAAAADGKDTLAVIRSSGELGDSLAAAFDAQNQGKAFLFPLVGRQKVLAILYAEAGDSPLDVNALELLASLAAHALEIAVREKRAAGLVAIAGADAVPRPVAPVAAAMTREEQDLHSRAQRFARVQVAEMRLYKSGAVKAGRAEARLYDSLRQDIDAGREAFHEEFIKRCPSMVDYFHLELVRTLANEDAALLGPDYPGPLV